MLLDLIHFLNKVKRLEKKEERNILNYYIDAIKEITPDLFYLIKHSVENNKYIQSFEYKHYIEKIAEKLIDNIAHLLISKMNRTPYPNEVVLLKHHIAEILVKNDFPREIIEEAKKNFTNYKDITNILKQIHKDIAIFLSHKYILTTRRAEREELKTIKKLEIDKIIDKRGRALINRIEEVFVNSMERYKKIMEKQRPEVSIFIKEVIVPIVLETERYIAMPNLFLTLDPELSEFYELAKKDPKQAKNIFWLFLSESIEHVLRKNKEKIDAILGEKSKDLFKNLPIYIKSVLMSYHPGNVARGLEGIISTTESLDDIPIQPYYYDVYFLALNSYIQNTPELARNIWKFIHKIASEI